MAKGAFIGVPTKKEALKFLEYIESTGTQYFNTGVIGKSGLKIVADIEWTELTNEHTLFGCLGNGQRLFAQYSKSDGGFLFAYRNYTLTTFSPVVNTRYNIEFDFTQGAQKMTVDGVVKYTGTDSTAVATGKNIYLLALNNNDAPSSYSKTKNYSYKIYDGEVLIRDYVSFEYTDGRIGLYDKVESKFYPNAGTGTFIAGSVVEEVGGKVVEVAREVKQMFIGVNGIARKVKKAWVGVNGVARLFFSGGLALSELPEGSLISINESGSPVLFYVGKHDYESSLNGAGRTLVVRKDLTSEKMYWNESAVGGYYNEYSGSTIDTWQNGTYKNKFDSNVLALAGNTKFYYTPGGRNKAVSTLSRFAFLLSLKEFGGSSSSANVEGSTLPISSLLKGSTSQWTRTIMKINDDNMWMAYAWTNSGTSTQVNYRQYSVRPAFTLPSNALVNPTPNADGSYTLLV